MHLNSTVSFFFYFPYIFWFILKNSYLAKRVVKIVLCHFQAFRIPLTWHSLVSTINGCIVTESKRSNFQFHFSKYLLSLSFQVFLDNNQLFLSTLRSYEVVSCLLAEDFLSFSSKWFRQHSISAVVEEKAANFAKERTSFAMKRRECSSAWHSFVSESRS